MICQSYLRLKIKFEFILFEGVSQLQIKTASSLSLCTKHGLEKPPSTASGGFGLIKRKIGICDQFVNVGAVIGGDCNPCAAAKMKCLVSNFEGLREPFEHRVDNLSDQPRVTAIVNDHDKFVSPKTEHLPLFIA